MTITITDDELKGTLKSMEIEVPERTKLSLVRSFFSLLGAWDNRRQMTEEEVFGDAD